MTKGHRVGMNNLLQVQILIIPKVLRSKHCGSILIQIKTSGTLNDNCINSNTKKKCWNG